MKENLRPSPFSFLPIGLRQSFDWVTPVALLGLIAIGVAFIFSAQRSINGDAWRNQLVWLAMGAVVYVGVSLIDYKLWMRWSHWAYFLTLALLIAVLIPGIGHERYGARRWLDFGPISLQPSEVAKLATLLMCAGILTRNEVGSIRQSFAALGKLALAAGVPMLLIVAQPDLGTALVIPPMTFALLYVAKLPRRFFAAASAAFGLLVAVVAFDTWRYFDYMTENNLSFLRDQGKYETHSWVPLHDYQRNRILSFVAPDQIDPGGIGWNIRQSLISVGSGGFSGKGWTEGTQAKLGYLPRGVAHNDFIFSVLAEEKGFLGSLLVLGLYGVVLFNGIRIAGNARDRFGSMLAVGVCVILSMHVFVNIAMTMGLMPITGLPLPFISYGGSFLVSCCLLQGLVQSVHRFRREY